MTEPAWLKVLKALKEKPEQCPNCESTDLGRTDYDYGDDADGRRGVRIKGRECLRCGVEWE